MTSFVGFGVTDVSFLELQNTKSCLWQRGALAPLGYLKAQGRKAVKAAAGEATEINFRGFTHIC